MARFGRASKEKLLLLDHELVLCLNDAIEDFDFSVIHTYRDKETQDKANEDGWSRLKWPFSKHNRQPARAVDIVPYPGLYESTYAQFFEMATYVLAAASKRGIRIRWGGHWKNYNGNGENDRDWAHFELYD